MKKIFLLLLLGIFSAFSVAVILSWGNPDAERISDTVEEKTRVLVPFEFYQLANKERNTPLAWNQCIADKATERAKYIVDNAYFEHSDLTGNKPYREMIEQCVDWEKAGENLAGGYYTTIEAHEAFMHSPTHRALILDTAYNQMGVGCVEYVCVEFFAN